MDEASMGDAGRSERPKNESYLDRVSGDKVLWSGPHLHGPKWDVEDFGIEKGVLWAIQSQRIKLHETRHRLGEITDELYEELRDRDTEIILDLYYLNPYITLDPLDEEELRDYMRHYRELLEPLLEEEEAAVFKRNIDKVTAYLVSKVHHFVPYTGYESYVRNLDSITGLVVFADTSTEPPTFLYMAHGLEVIRLRTEDPDAKRRRQRRGKCKRRRRGRTKKTKNH